MPNVVIATSGSGDTILVAAPGANKFIRVYGYVLMSAGATTPEFKDGAGNSLSGKIWACGAANGGVSASGTVGIGGWFDCAVNTSLVLNNSAAIAVGGHVNYSILG